MSDYKELLKTLRGLCSVKDYEPCDYNLEAADAIEQLVKERDYAMDIANNTHCSAMKKLQKNDETIAGLFRDRDILRRERDELATKCSQLVKERDAAVADLKTSADCDYCKWLVDGDCTDLEHEECHSEHWKWRGVEHE